MTWATNHNGDLKKLLQVQGSLTVDLIMVPRSELLTCHPSETGKDIAAKNLQQYSFLPVEKEGQIVGLYNAERWFHAEASATPVAEDYHPLSEEIIIGADASIFDFLVQADRHPTNLVISGNKVSGLVSLHDAQQLPVRAALFALITSLEMAMSYAIRKRWPDDPGWMSEMSDGRFMQMAAQIDNSKEADSFVDSLAFTQFSDKADLVRKSEILDGSRKEIEKAFKAVRKLRDKLAHANTYAQNETQAKSVCATVRTVYQLKSALIEYLSESPVLE